jgi:uncharacterized protein (DUF2345 family)
MQPKLGKLISSISPVAPEQVFTADSVDPDKAAQEKTAQISQKKGKYGAPKGKPFKMPSAETMDMAGNGWVEIALVDENGKPATGQKYEITLPNGKVVKGSTDSKGRAKIQGFVSGTCQLSLPALHRDAW